MFSREDFINEIMAILIIIISFSVAWFLMDDHRFTLSSIQLDSPETFYDLQSGSTIHSISRDFEQRGWIRHKEYLRIYAKLNGLSAIKAGEYELSNDLRIVDLLKNFVLGKVILHQITLIEGWNIKQTIAAIQHNDKLKKTLSDVQVDEIMQVLGYPDLHPEGQFLPDTYTFSRNTTDRDLLKTAHVAMDDVLNKAWQQRAENLPLATPYEALILASIVEKETGVVEERPLIAGVFTTRLRKKMKLQTDPTVIYGMGDDFKGNIKRKHLLQDTPYNTYTRKGLTPTPISMPGREAIKAVLHPREEGYLYFVAKGDGSHYFSKTLKEHNAAVRKYQLKK